MTQQVVAVGLRTVRVAGNVAKSFGKTAWEQITGKGYQEKRGGSNMVVGVVCPRCGEMVWQPLK